MDGSSDGKVVAVAVEGEATGLTVASDTHSVSFMSAQSQQDAPRDVLADVDPPPMAFDSFENINFLVVGKKE
jgi:hypothetical protein